MYDTKFKKKLSYGFFSKLMMNDSLERMVLKSGPGREPERRVVPVSLVGPMVEPATS